MEPDRPAEYRDRQPHADLHFGTAAPSGRTGLRSANGARQSRVPVRPDPRAGPPWSHRAPARKPPSAARPCAPPPDAASAQDGFLAPIEFDGAADRLGARPIHGCASRPIPAIPGRALRPAPPRQPVPAHCPPSGACPADISTTSARAARITLKMQSAGRPHSMRREIRAPRNCRCAKSSSSVIRRMVWPFRAQPRLGFHHVQQSNLGFAGIDDPPHRGRQPASPQRQIDGNQHAIVVRHKNLLCSSCFWFARGARWSGAHERVHGKQCRDRRREEASVRCAARPHNCAETADDGPPTRAEICGRRSLGIRRT